MLSMYKTRNKERINIIVPFHIKQLLSAEIASRRFSQLVVKLLENYLESDQDQWPTAFLEQHVGLQVLTSTKAYKESWGWISEFVVWLSQNSALYTILVSDRDFLSFTAFKEVRDKVAKEEADRRAQMLDNLKLKLRIADACRATNGAITWYGVKDRLGLGYEYTEKVRETLTEMQAYGLLKSDSSGVQYEFVKDAALFIKYTNEANAEIRRLGIG